MKKDLIDFINFIARDIPPGEVNSDGLEEDAIDIYEILVNESSPYDILLEQSCFIATKHRIEKHLSDKMLSKEAHASLPLLSLKKQPSRMKSVQQILSRLPTIPEYISRAAICESEPLHHSQVLPPALQPGHQPGREQAVLHQLGGHAVTHQGVLPPALPPGHQHGCEQAVPPRVFYLKPCHLAISMVMSRLFYTSWGSSCNPPGCSTSSPSTWPWS